MFLQGRYTPDITQVNKWIFGLARVKEIPAHVRSQSIALSVVDDLQGTHWEIFKVLHIRPTIAATCKHTFVCIKGGKTYLRTTTYVRALKCPFCSVVERDQKATGEFYSKVTEHWPQCRQGKGLPLQRGLVYCITPSFFVIVLLAEVPIEGLCWSSVLFFCLCPFSLGLYAHGCLVVADYVHINSWTKSRIGPCTSAGTFLSC